MVGSRVGLDIVGAIIGEPVVGITDELGSAVGDKVGEFDVEGKSVSVIDGENELDGWYEGVSVGLVDSDGCSDGLKLLDGAEEGSDDGDDVG